MSFKELLSDPALLKAIEESGYTTPTPIQAEAIPVVLQGRDLRGSAQTGTGKTAAFLLPVLQKILSNPSKPGKGPRVLILVPTRELAMQVAKETAKYGKYLDRVKTVCIYGGAPYPIQNRDLSRPYEVLVATPGRLMDHMQRGRISFGRLDVMILDEADRMLDMGFIEPVEEIAAATPPDRQTLMFSATFNRNVMNLSKRLLKNPAEIIITAQHEKHENIEQRLHNVDNIHHKERLLEHLLSDESVKQAIIFTSTKHQADILTDTLLEKGHDAAALHGDMNQRQRTKTIARLRKGEIRILVATDVAARGIDIQTITHVINFDLPRNAEDYVHRIGRTGRAGASGIALSFATARERHLVRQIENFTGHPMNAQVIAGFEPTMKASSSFEPRRGRGPGGPRPGGPRRPGGFRPSFPRKGGNGNGNGNGGPRKFKRF
ncbi:MAG TPA: DEAD/DEAH box helicase [Chlamydiales bacterium]|jgi:superfamily II DNA/RNA helicase